MKKLVLLGTLMGTLLFASCSTNNTSNNPPATNEQSAELKVQSVVIAPSSQPQLDETGSGKFVTGDKNSLFFQNDQNELLQTFTYTYGQRYLWVDVKGLEDVKECNVSACYPVVQAANPASFDWDIIKNQENPDFLAAAPVRANTQSSNPVNLTFRHLLHKLQVKLLAGEAAISNKDLESAIVKVVDAQPVAVLDLLQGTALSAKGKLVSLTGQGKVNSFLLPAQGVENLKVTVEIDGRTRSFELKQCQVNGQALTQLESGKTFVLTISITEEKIMVVDQQILGWENQGSGQGNIVI